MKINFLIISLMIGFGSCYAFEGGEGQRSDQKTVTGYYRLLDGKPGIFSVPSEPGIFTNRDFYNLIAHKEGVDPSQITIRGDNGRHPYINNDEPLSYDFLRESMMRVIKKPAQNLSAAASGAAVAVPASEESKAAALNQVSYKLMDGTVWSVQLPDNPTRFTNSDFYNLVADNEFRRAQDISVVVDNKKLLNNEDPLPYASLNGSDIKVVFKLSEGSATQGVFFPKGSSIRGVFLPEGSAISEVSMRKFNFKLLGGHDFFVEVAYPSDVGIKAIKGKDLYEAVRKSGFLPADTKVFRLVVVGKQIMDKDIDLPEALLEDPGTRINVIILQRAEVETAGGAGQEPAEAAEPAAAAADVAYHNKMRLLGDKPSYEALLEDTPSVFGDAKAVEDKAFFEGLFKKNGILHINSLRELNNVAVVELLLKKKFGMNYDKLTLNSFQDKIDNLLYLLDLYKEFDRGGSKALNAYLSSSEDFSM